MSPKCEVPTLGGCAITELAQSVIRAVTSTENELDVSLCLIELSSYFEALGATADIYQDLLQSILCSDYLDAGTRFLSMQLLLKETVNVLATGIFPFPYYERILQVISVQGAGLKVLNMKGVWVKEENMYYLFDIVRKLKNLHRLNIPYIANDELLYHIGQSCNTLRVLDISGESDVTEIGLECLYKGVTREALTIVDIGILGEENICHTDIAELILNLPNLTNLVSYSFVGKAINYIVKTKNPGLKTKLQYIHDTNTTAETINSISKSCPDLDSLYIDNPSRGAVSKISQLKLEKLKLNSFDTNELHCLLEVCGESILHLTILQGSGVVNFSRIAQSCPNLAELECYMMETLIHTEEAPFPQLQCLEVLHSNMSTNCLIYLLRKSPLLRRLAVGDVVNLSDEELIRLFSDNEFPNLEDIWFPNATYLTRASVEVLMDRCPSLVSLGQLSGWCVTFDDLVLLRAMIESANINLSLSPLGLFP